MHGNGNKHRCGRCGSKMKKDGKGLYCTGSKRKGSNKGKSCGYSKAWGYAGTDLEK